MAASEEEINNMSTLTKRISSEDEVHHDQDIKGGSASPRKENLQNLPGKSKDELNDDLEESQQKPETYVKRGPGRPKKKLKVSGDEEIEPASESNKKKLNVSGDEEIEPASESDTKRRPGRPRKLLNVDEARKQKTETHVKRGPGRPKKQLNVSGDEEIEQASESDMKRGPGRPRKQLNDDEVRKQKPETDVKRGPGRPEKQLNVRGDEECEPASMSDEKRGPGRPRKIYISEDRQQVSNSERKRGPVRPRKESSHDDESQQTPERDVKRGPGRPRRKLNDGYDNDSNRASTGAGKREPGRPKKRKAKRGPGRPRKRINDDDEDEDDDDDESCQMPKSSMKSGPGRPRKQLNDNGRQESNKRNLKKGHGRPRKASQQAHGSHMEKGAGRQIKEEEEEEEMSTVERRKGASDMETEGVRGGGLPGRKRRKPRYLVDDEETEEDGESYGGTAARRMKVQPAPKKKGRFSGKGKSGAGISKADRAKFVKEVEVWEETLERENYAKCPSCLCRRKALGSILDHYKRCSKNVSTGGEIACSKCGEKCRSKSALKYHLLKKHPTSDSGESEDSRSLSETKKLRRLFKKKIRVKCPRPDCNSSFSTFYGYQYHKKRCGVDPTQTERFPCPLCPDKVYLSKAGLAWHQKTIHVERKESVKDEDGQMTQRKAAQKAMRKVKLLDLDADPTVDKPSKKSQYYKFWYRITALAPPPGDDDIRGWEEGLGQAPPINPACPFCRHKVYSDIDSITSHYKTCIKNPNGVKTYNCKLCDYKGSKVVEIKEHVLTKHKKEYKSKVNSEQQDFSPNSSGESEDSDESYAFNQEWLQRKRRLPYQPVVCPSTFCLEKLEEIIHEQQSERLCLSSESLFQEFQPSTKSWPRLSPVEAAKYECNAEICNAPEGRADPTSLPLYGTSSEEKPSGGSLPYVTLNCGAGSVLAMAWCPVPLDRLEREQYAAITSYPEQGQVQQAFKATPGPGLIQLWAFGTLQSKNAQPQLRARIAHDAGSVRGLSWCPSGCWEDPTQSRPDQESRLGVLAAATSSGVVLVYSIPHPDSLQPQHVYKPIPSMVLKPKRDVGNEDCWFGPCVCLDWMPRKPHSKIAAGFPNGSVVIWNVGKMCSLMQDQNDDGSTVVYPIQAFPAHICLVQSVHWALADSNFLCSVGRDKNVHFWDIRWPAYPQTTCAVDATCSSQWTSLWNGILTGCHIPTKIWHHDPASPPGFLKHVWMSDLTMLAITYSEWLNCIAVTDIAGNISILALTLSLLPRASKYKQNVKHVKARVCERDKADPMSTLLTSSDATLKAEWNVNRGSQRWLLCGSKTGAVRLYHITVRDKR